MPKGSVLTLFFMEMHIIKLSLNTEEELFNNMLNALSKVIAKIQNKLYFIILG